MTDWLMLALAVVAGAATWELLVHLARRLVSRCWTVELSDRLPMVSHQWNDMPVPGLVTAVLDAVVAESREHPELTAARVTVRLPR